MNDELRDELAAELEPRVIAKIDPTDGCWLWTASLRSGGYGRIRSTEEGRDVPAHRYVYERLVGPIPPGLQLDHLCRVRRCVNPSHLEPVTQRENLLRGDTLPAKQIVRTHCPSGHPYSGGNLAIRPNGDRRCRQCGREQYWATRERLGEEFLQEKRDAWRRRHDKRLAS